MAMVQQEPSVQQLLPDDTSHIKDPVQKAVIDNILGKVPSKVPQEKHKCDICNIEVAAKAAYLTHLNGARHAKRLKEETLEQESKSPYIKYLEEKRMYYCKLCNASLNAKIQISAHLQGSKHKNKVASGGKVDEAAVAVNIQSIQPLKLKVKKPPAPLEVAHPPALSTVEPKSTHQNGPSKEPSQLLFCPTCNIHVNSEIQLQQHVSSKKHLNKFNGVVISKPRVAPYPTKSPKSIPMSGTIGARGMSSLAGVRGANMVRPRYTSENLYQRRNPSGGGGPQSNYRSYQYHEANPYSLSNNFVSSGIYGSQSSYSNYNRHYQGHPDYDYPPSEDVRGYYDAAMYRLQ